MTAQEFANEFNVYVAKDMNDTVYWYSNKPSLVEGMAKWAVNGGEYAYAPLSLKMPEGDWKDSLLCPNPDILQLVLDQPIQVSNNGKVWYNRYFAKAVEGKVFTWINGATSWSSDSSSDEYTTGWDYWRLLIEK